MAPCRHFSNLNYIPVSWVNTGSDSASSEVKESVSNELPGETEAVNYSNCSGPQALFHCSISPELLEKLLKTPVPKPCPTLITSDYPEG